VAEVLDLVVDQPAVPPSAVRIRRVRTTCSPNTAASFHLAADLDAVLVAFPFLGDADVVGRRVGGAAVEAEVRPWSLLGGPA
jgi:hypothetical protein